MATNTSKFSLVKPAGNEFLSRSDYNNNLDKIDAAMNASRPLYLSKSSVSSLPTTITNSKITATMICKPESMRLSNKQAMMGDWTVTTADGSVTIDGDIVGTTVIYLWLEEPMG